MQDPYAFIHGDHDDERPETGSPPGSSNHHLPPPPSGGGGGVGSSNSLPGGGSLNSQAEGGRGGGGGAAAAAAAHESSSSATTVTTTDDSATVTLASLGSKAVRSKPSHAPVYTPLMKAAAMGEFDALLELIEQDDSLNLFEKDQRGRTALDWARLGRHRECAVTLEEAMAAEIETQRRKQVARQERDRLLGTIDRNARARRGLLLAIDARTNAHVYELLASTDKTKDDVPPLTRKEFVRSSKLILSRAERKKEKYWLDIESDTGGTALMLACSFGDLPLLKQLLDPRHGLKIDYETQRGHTALTWSAVCGHLDAVTLLLDAGADLRRATRHEGKTALHMAAFHGHPPVVQAILDRILRIAIDERHFASTGQLRMTDQERHQKEAKWMQVYEEFVQLADKSGKAALEHAVNVPDNGDVVNLLRGAKRRIKARAWQLEQEALKGKPTECCQGCGFVTRADKIEWHEINVCTKRIVGCELCGQQLPFDQLPLHQEMQCPNRLLDCAHMDRGCTEKVTAENFEAHVAQRCKYRDVICRVPCDAVLQFRHREDHEQNRCPNRSVVCPLECDTPGVKAVELRSHMKHDCPKRCVPCRVGCGLKLPFEEREAHEQEVCIQPCMWEGCAERVGPETTREVHEKFLCPRRVVQCPLECGIVGLCAGHRDTHLNLFCPNRIQPCPQGCGQRLQAKQMEQHLDADGGTCPERLRRCPFDIVRVNGREGRRLEVEVSPGEYVYCSVRGYNRKEGAFKLIYPDTVRWQRLQDLTYKFIDNAASTWKCGWIHHDTLDIHMNDECHLRQQRCLLNCGQTLYVGGMEEHTKNCPRRVVHCPFACGKVMEQQYVEEHETKECELRTVRCQKCGEDGIREIDLKDHWKLDCAMGEVRCGYGCGALVPRGELDRHMAGEDTLTGGPGCPKRPARCPECGLEDDPGALGGKLFADELELHRTTECERRVVECRIGCGEEMEERYRDAHEQQVCPKRHAICENCGAGMDEDQLADHKILDCPGFLRYCPLGCGIKVITSDLARHQRDECSKRHSAHGHLILCPLGCGKEIAYHEQFVHVTGDCPKRIVDCPQKCGEIVPARALGDHKLVCPVRTVPCGFSAPACARKLHSWCIASVDVERGEYNQEVLDLDAAAAERLVEYEAAKAEKRALPEEEAPRFDAIMERAEKERSELLARRAEVSAKRVALDERIVREGKLAMTLELVKCDEHDSTALLRAVIQSEPATVMALIQRLRESGVDELGIRKELDHSAMDGHSTLTKACQYGDLNMVKLLLREGASLNKETANGRTPLIECAKHGRVEVARFLIEEGAVMDHVNKQKTTAFDWAMNSGNSKVLRHLVREYRVQKDLARLFILIMGGKLEEINEIVKDGEPFRPNHQWLLEQEIAECDQEIEEAEKTDAIIAEDLEEKKPELERCLAAEAVELAKVKALQDEAAANAGGKDEVRELMLKDYDDAMLFLQRITKTDITEVTDMQSRFVPDRVKLVMQVVCILLGLEPKVTVDKRRQRFARRGATGAAAGTTVDWWVTSRALLTDGGFIGKLRYYNKQQVDDEVLAKVVEVAGDHLGSGIAYDEYSAALERQKARAALRNDPGAAQRRALEKEERIASFVAGGMATAEAMSKVNAEDAAEEKAMADADEAEGGGYLLIEAMSKWCRAILAYRQAALEHAEFEKQEIEERRKMEAGLPALEKAQYHVRIARFGVTLLQRELDESAKHVKFLEKKIAGAEERIRIAKIFQAVSQTGHTLVSWAAMVDQPEILELFFDHGAAPGFTDEVYALSATVIQLLWRHHHWMANRGTWAPSLAFEFRTRTLLHQDKMANALGKLHYFRQHRRLPLTEALYNGNYRIIDVFKKKHIPMVHAARSWLSPSPMCPYFPTAHAARIHANGGRLEKPMNMYEAAVLGAQERGCDEYLAMVGWVDKDHKDSKWAITQERAKKEWGKIEETMRHGEKEKLRRRRMRKAKEELEANEAELERLLSVGVMDWDAIVAVILQGAPVDMEAKDGATALMRACEEDTDSLYYTPCYNADKNPVLAVELLLDRRQKRPRIEHENKHGHVALSWATIKDRQPQMEALVKRGADVNYRNKKHGRTPLIWAAIFGKHRSVRFLLEAGADQTIEDDDGKTAISWAKESNYVETISVLLQFKQGNQGIVLKERGAAVEQVPCCWGCGLITDRRTLVQHESTDCPRRAVKCRNEGCFIDGLQAWEQERHELELCPQRVVDCPLGCGARMRRTLMTNHTDNECVERMVDCALGCERTMRFKHRAKHEIRDCPHRLVPCKHMCHLPVRARDLGAHARLECPNRSVRCRVGCGLTMTARLRDAHEEEQCDARVVECQWNCKIEGLKARDQVKHEEDECARRPLPCPNKCGKRIQERSMKTHLANACGRRFVQCPLNCKRAVRFDELDQHTTQECDKRHTRCPLGCGRSFLAQQTEIHCKHECANRVIVCALCGEGIPAGQLERHKDLECPLRQVECPNRGCYKRLQAEQMEQHAKFECRKRLVFCLQGCGMQMFADRRKGHHEKHCEMRYAPCPYGCPKQIREKDRVEHIEKWCVRRPV